MFLPDNANSDLCARFLGRVRELFQPAEAEWASAGDPSEILNPEPQTIYIDIKP